jgi:hypothetical protein
MALFTQEALVLRGVSVLEGGKAVGLRLGFYEAMPQAKAIPFSERHPSSGCLGTEPTSAWRPLLAFNPAGNSAVYGAGRPGSHAGVFVRRSPALHAGGTFDHRDRWSLATGGAMAAAATRLCLMAKPVASVADTIASPSASSLAAFGLQPQQRRQEMPVVEPAPRTLAAASTRGIGGR